MLKALYDYALKHHLTLPPGYVNKTVKAWVWVKSNDPSFVTILAGDASPVSCPDVGSLANSKDKSNVLVEKRSVIFPDEVSLKNDFFMKALESAGEKVPEAKYCYTAMQNPEITKKIRDGLDSMRIKPADRIGFRVDDQRLIDAEGILAWWLDFRKQYQKNDSSNARCLITGLVTTPMTTTPTINGLSIVGGHAAGDALICFDKSAFCSYDLKQAANAPVSEEAYTAVKGALDDLLKRAPILAGMKFVHWYSRELPADGEENDLIGSIFGLSAEGDDVVPEETDAEGEQKERTAVKTANELVTSVKTGEHIAAPDCRYYILMLSGVTGRIMVRRYEEGSYEELVQRLGEWEKGIALVSRIGTGLLSPCKLTARLIRLMKYQKTDSRPFDRLSKELAGITPAVLNAMLSGAPLPDSVASRALAYIRSRLLTSDDDDENRQNDTLPDGRACQWLKIWLLRKNTQTKEWLMETFNPDAREPAYLCGAIMAVYAAIQHRAMNDVNATIAQRYYGAASQTPALVIGQLSRLSVHHLEKIEKGMAAIFMEYLHGLYAALGANPIPTTLTLEGQSEFALGYYQMSAKMKRDAQERKAAREEKEEE